MEDWAWEIVGWEGTYENSRSRQVDNCRWVALPNRFDGDKISELIGSCGEVGYAIWCSLIAVGSRCKPRGLLIRKNGHPHDARSLSRITGLSIKGYNRTFPVAEACGLIVKTSLGRHLDVTPTSLGRQSKAIEGKGREGKEWNGKEGKGREAPEAEPDPESSSDNGKARSVALLRYMQSIEIVLQQGSTKGRYTQDLEAVKRWWNGIIWPKTLDTQEGERRAKHFKSIANRAIKKQGNMMAYIEAALDKEQWSNPNDSSDTPRAVDT